jgi:hypothetical protein
MCLIKLKDFVAPKDNNQPREKGPEVEYLGTSFMMPLGD